jgi:hypothetical protein
MKKEAINSFFEKFLQSRIFLYCVIVLVVLKIFTSVIVINFPINIFFADITKSALVDMINQTRQSSGIAPLTENAKLEQVARMKAEDMIQKGYFAHTSPQGITPWHWFYQAGYIYEYAGENLAIGFYDSSEVYQAWLDSPSHKANILSANYKEVGTAVLQGFGPNNAIVVVQTFASPQKQQVQKPIVSNVSENNKVLEQTQELVQPVLQGEVLANSDVASEPFSTKLLNFIAYTYNDFLQDIIYGLLVIVMGVMLFVIFFNFKVPVKREVMFRSIIIMILLLAGLFFNKDFILSIIPHQIII